MTTALTDLENVGLRDVAVHGDVLDDPAYCALLGTEHAVEDVARSTFLARVTQSRERLARFDPDQPRDGDGKWTSSAGGHDAASYLSSYGDFADEESIDLGGGQNLAARFFEGGDAHLVIDQPDGTSMVLFEVENPTQMRDLAYGIEDLLDIDADDGDDFDSGVLADAVIGDAYLAVGAQHELTIRGDGDDDRSGADISADEARDLAVKLHALADRWEEHFDGGESGEVVVARSRRRVAGKFNPDQARDNEGRWTADGLGLAERISLEPGLTVAASGLIGNDPDDRDDAGLAYALVGSPEGMQAILAVSTASDVGEWFDEDSDVSHADVHLTAAERADLAAGLRDAKVAAEARWAQFLAEDKAHQAGMSTAEPMLGLDAIAGQAGSGDHVVTWRADGDIEAGWYLELTAPAKPSRLDPDKRIGPTAYLDGPSTDDLVRALEQVPDRAGKAVEKPLARFNPDQERDSHGRWTDGTRVDPALDKLKLDGRIDLAEGERLEASGKIGGPESSVNAVVWALTHAESGPSLRIAVVRDEDAKRWSAADKGGTVLLDRAGIGLLNQQAGQLIADAKRHQAELRAMAEQIDDFDGHDKSSAVYRSSGVEWTFDPDLTEDQRQMIVRFTDLVNGGHLAEGVLASGPWGDLVYRMNGHSNGDLGSEDVEVELGVRPAAASSAWSFDDLTSHGDDLLLPMSHLRKFGRRIDDITRQAESEVGHGQ